MTEMEPNMAAARTAGAKSPRILVLMATFNGEQWLRSQLQSIAAQQNVELSLMVSDDASSDGTVEVLRTFCAHRLELRLLQASVPSGSAGKNFIRLMLAADPSGHDYVALCDQDDEWHADKLSRAADCLVRSDAAGYSAAVRAFWPDGRVSILRQSPATTLADYVFEGAGQGCTFVLRADAFRAAQRLMERHRELLEPLHYHDWLLYALCRAQGRTWLFDARPCMQYRQHAANDTGARSNGAGLMKRLRLIRSGWYGLQVEAMARVCVAAAGTRSVGASRYLALIDSSRSALVVRMRLGAFVMLHGRRRFTDRVALLLAAAGNMMSRPKRDQ
jgi:rhamnosyltransferase